MKKNICIIGVFVVSACGGDSSRPIDATLGVDQLRAVDQAMVAPDLSTDVGTPNPEASAPDVASVDAGSGWPPAPPYHTGKQCSLPTCDPSGPETIDLSGTWTQSVTTNSQTCNSLARVMDPRLQPGHVETLKNQSIPRAGECVYKEKVGGTLVGVIKGNIMVTCEVMAVTSGVTPVVESQITFTGGVGTGPAWTYLFDVPLPPTNCQANCSATLTKE